MIRARRFTWITALLTFGAAAAEPEPGLAAIELGRLFTTPAERLGIESMETEATGLAERREPHENADGSLTSAVLADSLPTPPAAPAAMPESPATPPPHMHGRLRRDGRLLAEWPRKLLQHKAETPGFRVGARRVAITPTRQGGWLQGDSRRLVEWPRQASAR